MEMLSHRIQDAVARGAWKSIVVGEIPLAHLFFADDLVLFAEATPDQGRVIRDCLDQFCLKLGEKINYSKSNVLFSRSVATSMKQEISNLMAISTTTEFGNYLRVPMLCGRMTSDRYHYLLDKVRTRLRGW